MKPMKILFALYLCLTAHQVGNIAAAESKPNVVFFLVDDQRNTSLGCVELLRDRIADPTELVNLADNPDYKAVLQNLREKSSEYKEQYSRHQ